MVCIPGFQSLISSSRSAIIPVLNRITFNHFTRNMASSNKAALIFLHGLGDEGASWHMQLKSLIPSYLSCICPTAPVQAVTLNMGMHMNSWFDLRSLDPRDPEDEEGIKKACKQIHELIEEQEKHGIHHERIMIGGFSQGGALALYSALKYPKKLAGVVALSCWLPLHKKFPAEVADANKNIQILQCHGDQDVVVPLPWGKATETVLSSFLENYKFKVYQSLGHSSSMTELNDVVEFIKIRVPK